MLWGTFAFRSRAPVGTEAAFVQLLRVINTQGHKFQNAQSRLFRASLFLDRGNTGPVNLALRFVRNPLMRAATSCISLI